MIEKIKNEPALVSGAVQAILGLLLAFGVDLNHVQTGAILAVTAAILAFFVRQAVVPNVKLEDDVEDDQAGYYGPPWVSVLAIILVVVVLLILLGHLHIN